MPERSTDPGWFEATDEEIAENLSVMSDDIVAVILGESIKAALDHEPDKVVDYLATFVRDIRAGERRRLGL